jgi:hypothetical protein
MPVKQGTPEDVYGEWNLQDLRGMAKAHNGLNLGPSGRRRPSTITTSMRSQWT